MKNPIRATPALPTDSAELAALRQVFEPHFLSTGISPERLAYDPLERLANGQYFYTHAQRAWEAFLLGFGIGRRPASSDPATLATPTTCRSGGRGRATTRPQPSGPCRGSTWRLITGAAMPVDGGRSAGGT